TKEGESLYEYILNDSDIENGSEYHITIQYPEHYCFTIINEYYIDTINNGKPFQWIKTYYDQGGDLHILKVDHPPIPDFYQEIHGSITIRNAPVIEHWQQTTRAIISSFRQTKSNINAQSNFKPDEDLFVVMKGEGEKKFRYLYARQDDIPIVNNS